MWKGMDEGSGGREGCGFTRHHAPQAIFRGALHEHRHVVTNGISREQPVGLVDHLFDSDAAEGGKLLSEVVHDLGDTLVLLQLIHWSSLGHPFAGRQPTMFSCWSPAVRSNDGNPQRVRPHPDTSFVGAVGCTVIAGDERARVLTGWEKLHNLMLEAGASRALDQIRDVGADAAV